MAPRAEALGMMICVSGLILSIIYLLASGNSWGNWKIWVLGICGGFAYSVGFFVLITNCLTIGPGGPDNRHEQYGNDRPLVIGLLFFGEWENLFPCKSFRPCCDFNLCRSYCHAVVQ